MPEAGSEAPTIGRPSAAKIVRVISVVGPDVPTAKAQMGPVGMGV
jgi:hypothetical protein